MLCPASATATRSPGRTSSACQRSSEPRLSVRTRRSSSWTGASCSSGVIRPVRPMRNSTSRTSVSALRSGYFQAAAQWGSACQRSAGGRCSWRSTTPSVANGNAWRYQCSRQWRACSSVSTGWLNACVSGKPSAASCPSRAFMLSGPFGQSQTNRPIRAAVSLSRPLLAMAPATRPRAPALPCDVWTCRSNRQ